MNGAIEVWQWINDNGTGLGAMAAVITAVIAGGALRATANDSRDRSRPMVVAEFLPAEHSDSTIDFRIRNYGQSVAHDVLVAFDPEIPDTTDPTSLTPFLKRRYAKTIQHLSPGQELRNIWWSGEAHATGELVNSEPTPDEVRVTVRYRGGKRSKYEDHYDLTIESVTLTTFSTSSASVPGRLKSFDKNLVSISRSLAALASAPKR